MTKTGWLKEQFKEVQQEISEWPKWKVESVESTELHREAKKTSQQLESAKNSDAKKIRC